MIARGTAVNEVVVVTKQVTAAGKLVIALSKVLKQLEFSASPVLVSRDRGRLHGDPFAIPVEGCLSVCLDSG